MYLLLNSFIGLPCSSFSFFSMVYLKKSHTNKIQYIFLDCQKLLEMHQELTPCVYT